MKNIWQLQDAKSKLSELVNRAQSHGAQIITRSGKKTVVILSYEEYQRLQKPVTGLSQFLIDSPLAGSGLVVERDKRRLCVSFLSIFDSISKTVKTNSTAIARLIKPI